MQSIKYENNNGIIDSLINKTKNNDSEEGMAEAGDIFENMRNMKDTATDMHYELFVNDDKVADKEHIQYFQKPEYQENNYNDNDDNNYNYNNNNEYNNNNLDVDMMGTIGPTGPPRMNNNSDMDKEDMQMKKLEMLRKLFELKEAGVTLSRDYNMNNDYKNMKFEYDMHVSVRERKHTIKMLSTVLTYGSYFLEKGNEKFNPFDFDLDGWSKSLSSSIEEGEYIDVFGDLHNKYFKSGKSMSPELKLLTMVMMSMVTFHIQKKYMGGNLSTAQELLKNQNLTEQLRNQSRSNKQTYNQSVNKKMNEEHEKVNNDIREREYLRQQEKEYLMKQQQQMAYENLHKQMEAQRSYSESYNQDMQPRMSLPPQKYVDMLKHQNYMAPAYETERVNQILKMQQSNNMEESNNENLKNTPSHSGQTESKMSEDIDDILSGGQNTTKSVKISTIKKKKKRGRGRPRKHKIEVNIDTDNK